MTQRLVLDPPGASRGEDLARIVQCLRDGEIVAAPSDTVYGYLASPDRPEALERLRRLKGRPGPFLILLPDVPALAAFADVPDPARHRLESVWPGPYTVLLQAREQPAWGTGTTIGVRVPDSDFLRPVLHAFPGGLLSTSANPPGDLPPRRAADVADGLDLALVVDAGEAASDVPSTLVDWTVHPPRLVRAGAGDPGPLLDLGNFRS